MPLLLPNLDDRRWADLIDEGRSLIPVYGPEWTDHNVHDPGITIVELLAWIAEMDIYRLNQISDDERRKFLALIGVFPRPPRPGRTVLSIRLKDGMAPVTLPRRLEFGGMDPSNEPIRYRTLNDITVVPGYLEALQFRDALGFQNLTPTWRRREFMYPFGKAPMPGVEFYLGLSHPLPIGVPIDLFLTFRDGYSGREEQRRFRKEVSKMERDCSPPANPCLKPGAHPPPEKAKAEIRHYGVRTVWEFLALVNGKNQWIALNAPEKEIEDGTRALTFDGVVRVRLPTAMTPLRIGAVVNSLYYLRCRFEAGTYDGPPVLQDVAFNGVPVKQSVPANMSFDIDANAAIVYSSDGPPKPNDSTTLRMELDPQKRIKALTFGDGVSTDPKFRILEYKEPTAGSRGLLNIEGVLLGFGNDFPTQQLTVPAAPVERSSFHLYTLEDESWRDWESRSDFYASTRRSSDYLLEPTEGTVTLGNGENGRVAPRILTNVGPEKCLIFATYRTTRAEAGNLAAGKINQLADSNHNRALLYDPNAVPNGWEKLKSELESVTNTIVATGGAPAETIAQAAGRADRLVDTSERAVTLEDYEQLALQTPGTRVARATARANLHSSFPCFDAPGMITVIVLPYLPSGRPVPSAGLLRTVAAYLRRRRIIGTRVEVVGPKYLDVTVRASVQSRSGTNKTSLQQAIVKTLNDFLDPLIGGVDGSGWPFGRDVYRSEIMRVIDEVIGVDHVLSMDLIAEGCEPQCGNVCLGPTWLVTAGPHEITVL